MSRFARTKRITYPLNDKVKNRIVGRETAFASSGSEHSGENDVDDESPCLTDLLYDFPEESAVDESHENVSDTERDPSVSDPTEENESLLNPTAYESDAFKNLLVAHVCKALDIFSPAKLCKSVLRRHVIAFLRGFGYNAAVCKTKWENSGGLAAGSYEFIDVVRSDSAATRYVVDTDFAGEFDIARQTSHYERVLHTLPRVFVGRCEELKQIVKFMSDAAKRSLKSRGLHLPPWRKNRYMQNKWLGPYLRTMNMIPANSLPASPTFAVKCRSIGFVAVNSHLAVPATARTR
ncbi:hypothetical protein RJ639_039737 [Escallonia herrerae]|uniref:Uncharacterized protein n=1 Tax=Escallonia herrerae TaxID=1293975 RepID=A0AA88WQS2_9ASTE|nr:hypothetical protein RJ639_039737 [Escallonia herrerae]